MMKKKTPTNHRASKRVLKVVVKGNFLTLFQLWINVGIARIFSHSFSLSLFFSLFTNFVSPKENVFSPANQRLEKFIYFELVQIIIYQNQLILNGLKRQWNTHQQMAFRLRKGTQFNLVLSKTVLLSAEQKLVVIWASVVSVHRINQTQLNGQYPCIYRPIFNTCWQFVQ